MCKQLRVQRQLKRRHQQRCIRAPFSAAAALLCGSQSPPCPSSTGVLPAGPESVGSLPNTVFVPFQSAAASLPLLFPMPVLPCTLRSLPPAATRSETFQCSFSTTPGEPGNCILWWCDHCSVRSATATCPTTCEFLERNEKEPSARYLAAIPNIECHGHRYSGSGRATNRRLATTHWGNVPGLSCAWRCCRWPPVSHE